MNDLVDLFLLGGLLAFIAILIHRMRAKRYAARQAALGKDLRARRKSFRRNEIVCAIIDSVYFELYGDDTVIVGSHEDAAWLASVISLFKPREIAELRRAVHETICSTGREAYEWHMKNPSLNYPDHSISPPALGYAIKHGKLTPEEVAAIRFDHGETAEEYVVMADRLLDKVMAQLKAGTAYIDWTRFQDMEEPEECFDNH